MVSKRKATNPTVQEREQLLKERENGLLKQEADLQKLRDELDKQKAELIRNEKDASQRVQILLKDELLYGLTRNRILCKHWHKNNPEAARHMFGFKNWNRVPIKYTTQNWICLSSNTLVPKSQVLLRCIGSLGKYFLVLRGSNWCACSQ